MKVCQKKNYTRVIEIDRLISTNFSEEHFLLLQSWKNLTEIDCDSTQRNIYCET